MTKKETMMDHTTFSRPERVLAFIAGFFNLIVGFAFFFLPELDLPLWPVAISPVLTCFIGAIIIGNGVGALWLSGQSSWKVVRPLALVAAVYGTLTALGLLYNLLWLNADSFFWLYFLFDVPFLLVFYLLFIYHDLMPLFTKTRTSVVRQDSHVSTIR
jgi:hypothetical protein